MEPKEDDPEIFLDAVLSLQYETQHFDFHPRSFLDIVYNVFFESITTSLTQMKQYMIQELKANIPPNVIKAQTDILLQKIVEQLDKSIDKLEVYLSKHVLSIDEHAILPEDEIHIKSPCTEEDDKLIDAEIEELKQKILQEKARRVSLKKTVVEQKEVKAYLLSLQKELKCLLDMAHQAGVTPESIDSLYSKFAKITDPCILDKSFEHGCHL